MGWLVLAVLSGFVVWVGYKVAKPDLAAPEGGDAAPGPSQDHPSRPNRTMIESDAQRLAAAPGRAFDWVARELSMPTPKALDDLRRAFLSAYGEGHEKAVRLLEGNWPSGSHWPQGEAYLRTLGWRSPDEFGNDDVAHDAWGDEYEGPEVMDLLYQRLFHVSSRLYRDEQVRSFLDSSSPYFSKKCIGVVVNRDGMLTKREDPCGFGKNKRLGKEEGLELLREPAHEHPACRCTVDPDLRR